MTKASTSNPPTSDPPKAPEHISLARGTKVTFTWIVELLTVFGTIGFLGSILLNGYVFSHWGISFLQVASLADVVMSGLQLSIDFAVISGMIVVGFVIGKVLYGISPALHEVRQATLFAKAIFAFRNFGILTILVATLPFIGYMFLEGVTKLYVVNLVGIAVGYVVGSINTSEYWVGGKFEKGVTVGITSLILGLILFAYAQAFLSPEGMIGGSVDKGFLSSRRVFRMALTDRVCPSAAVLWIGERSLVARCDGSHRIVLLDHGENILMR